MKALQNITDFISKLADLSIIVITLAVIFNTVIFLIKNKGRKRFDSSVSLQYILSLLLSNLENEKSVYEKLGTGDISPIKLHYLVVQLMDFGKLCEETHTFKTKLSKTFLDKQQLELATFVCERLVDTFKHQERLIDDIKGIKFSSDCSQILSKYEDRIALIDVLIFRIKVNIIRKDFEKNFADLNFKEAELLDLLFKTGINK